MQFIRALAITLLVVISVAGCDDASSSTPDAGTTTMVRDTGPQPSGRVTGTVTYEGSATGALTVGVFQHSPPMGPPIEFFYTTSPGFPQAYVIENVPAGTYYVSAVLDIGADNPTLPGSEDLISSHDETFTFTNDEAFALDLNLTDP